MRKTKPIFFRDNPVFLIGVLLSVIALTIGLFFLAMGPSVVEGYFHQFAVKTLSSDGQLSQHTAAILKTVSQKIIPSLFLFAVLVLFFVLAERFFSARLLATGSATRPATIPPILLPELGWLFAIVLVGLAVRMHHLTRGLSFDEIWTALFFVDADSLWKTMSSQSQYNNHIAFSILARLSQFTFGRHEWALRLPALVLGIGTLPLLWLFARQWIKPNLALLSALCLALSPVHVIWSQSARGYTGLTFFVLLSSFFFLKILKKPTRSYTYAFIVSSVLAIYFHLYGALVTIAQGLFLLFCAVRQLSGKNRNLRVETKAFRVLWFSFPAIVILSLLCYAPILPSLILNIMWYGRGDFIPIFPISVFSSLAGKNLPLFAPVIIVVFLFGLYRFRKYSVETSWYFTFLLMLPLSVVWFSRPFHLYPRFFVYFIPLFVLLLIVGAHHILNALKKIPAGFPNNLLRTMFYLLAVAVMLNYSHIAWNKVPEAGFRNAVRALETDANEQTALCAIGGGTFGVNFFEYYATREIKVPLTMAEFMDIADTYSEIRCAYCKTNWEKPGHSEIGEYLKRNSSETMTYDNVTVFIYRRGDKWSPPNKSNKSDKPMAP